MGKKSSLFSALLLCITSSSFATPTSDIVLPELTQEAQHIPASTRINNLFIRSHYKAYDLNDAFSKKIFARYLDNLDYNRMIFLASDIEGFKKYEKQFDDALAKGSLEFAFEIFNRRLERQLERYQYAMALLKSPMQFTDKEKYEFDREEQSWATSIHELDEIWRKRVKYDALNLKLTGKEWSEIQEILKKRYHYAIKRLTQYQNEDVFSVIMNSYARAIEAHTSYLSPRNAERFQTEMNLSLEGIGAVLQTEDDYTIIRSLVSGGPADSSERLKPQDRIIGVAQDDEDFVDIIGWRLDDVVELIKGPKGTTVRLQVLGSIESGDTEPKTVAIERDTIRLEDRAAKSEVFVPSFGSLDRKIGVITIPSFYNNLSKDIEKELNNLRNDKVDGIIVDLRSNGGGSLTEATKLTGLFIDKGPVVQVKEQNSRIIVHNDQDERTVYDGPLTVLVDRYSASASEIFAAAMQDYGRALVIGEQTFGKGTVQQHRGLGKIFDFYDNPLGNVQYTIAKFYRINGGSTQHRGVIPDITFPTPIAPEEWGESQEDNALPWDSIRHIEYTSVGNVIPYVNPLTEKFNSRIQQDPEFQYLFEDINEYKKIKDDTTISLNEKERLQKQEDTKVERLARVNARLKRLELEPIKNIDEAPEVLEDIDPWLDEAARITQDFIELGRFAMRKK